MSQLRRRHPLSAAAAIVALLVVACGDTATIPASPVPSAATAVPSATALPADATTLPVPTATTPPRDATAPPSPPTDAEPSQPPVVVSTTPFAVSVGTADEWLRMAVTADDAVDAESGALFFDLATTAGELVALTEPVFFGYSWSSNGRYVLAHGRAEQRLLDRQSGATYGWRSDDHRLVGVPHDSGLLLLQSQSTECSFAFVQLDGPSVAIVSEFVLPPGDRSCGSVVARLSPDQETAFLLINGAGSRNQTQLMSVAVGAGTVVALGSAVSGMGALELLAGGDTVLLISASRDETTATLQLDRYSWRGELLAELRIEAKPGLREINRIVISPDASNVAWQTQLPLAVPAGAGGSEHWPVVSIADATTGELRFRVVRASLTNGIRTLSWLADSSAIVVATPDGYALLSAQDGALASLPFGTVGHFNPLPVPAPDDPSRFLFDGRVVDANAIAIGPASPVWGGRWWNGAAYEWGPTSKDLRVARWLPPGRDFGPGGLSSLGLPPRLEQPPFPDSVRLRVAGISQLALLRVPVADADVITTVANGVTVTVTNAGPGAWPPGCDSAAYCTSATRSDRDREGAWLIHVRTPDGAEGWVRSEFLVWTE